MQRLLHVWMLCMFYCGLSMRINITGGSFMSNSYMDSHIIRAYEFVGPKMCIKDCMAHSGCNAINFKRGSLTCEILTVSYPGDTTMATKDVFFSQIDGWTQDNTTCWPNPCKGRTKCVEAAFNQHVCITFSVPCDKQPCRNSGTCRNGVHGYRCLCAAGYNGTNCEYTPCTGIVCINGGTCVISGASWYCQCPAGYSGTLCQNTPCTGKTCYNSGTCVISGSTYNCKCRSGYYGTWCQNTPCTGVACKYDGTCTVVGSGWECCYRDFWGSTICNYGP